MYNTCNKKVKAKGLKRKKRETNVSMLDLSHTDKL